MLVKRLLCCLLCVVVTNASVIVNIYDDDVEPRKASAVHDCSLLACEQRCRSLGFPGGACVNDRCKCDIMGSNDIKICDVTECEDSCSALGFFGGECVAGKCKCDIPNANEIISLSSSSIDTCDPSWCQPLCDGYCIGDFCYCSKNHESKRHIISSSDIIPLSSSSIDSCDPSWCQSACTGQGYPNSICIGDECYCYKNHESKRHLISSSDIIPLPSSSIDSCDPSWCQSTCTGQGYPNSICIGDKCYCYKNHESKRHLISSSEIISLSSSSVNSCDPSWCQSACKRQGYPSAMCIGDKCYCYKIDASRIRSALEITDNDKTKSLNTYYLF